MTLGKRGAYFFVIDAFIAAAILSFTLVLIFNLFIEQPSSEQSFTYAHDYINFLSTTEVRDFRHAVIDELISEGQITEVRHTLAEQVIIFFNQTEILNATNLLAAAAESLPATLDINVSLKKSGSATQTVIFEQEGSSELIPQLHLAARSVEYALINQTDIIGPYVIQVEVWT